MHAISISHLTSSSNLCNNSTTCNLSMSINESSRSMNQSMNHGFPQHNSEHSVIQVKLQCCHHGAAQNTPHLRRYGLGGRNRAYQTGKTRKLHNSNLHRLAYHTENPTFTYKIIPKTQPPCWAPLRNSVTGQGPTPSGPSVLPSSPWGIPKLGVWVA